MRTYEKYMKNDSERNIIRRRHNRTVDCWILFRSHLVKKTRPRVAVVHILQEAKKPLSAKDILEISNLSPATVHRTINVLQKINFIHQSHLESHVEKNTAYYEI